LHRARDGSDADAFLLFLLEEAQPVDATRNRPADAASSHDRIRVEANAVAPAVQALLVQDARGAVSGQGGARIDDLRHGRSDRRFSRREARGFVRWFLGLVQYLHQGLEPVVDDVGLEIVVVEGGFEDVLVGAQDLVGPSQRQFDEKALRPFGLLVIVLRAIDLRGFGRDHGDLGIEFVAFQVDEHDVVRLVSLAQSEAAPGVDVLPLLLVAAQVVAVAAAVVGELPLSEFFARLVRNTHFDDGATPGNVFFHETGETFQIRFRSFRGRLPEWFESACVFLSRQKRFGRLLDLILDDAQGYSLGDHDEEHELDFQHVDGGGEGLGGGESLGGMEGRGSGRPGRG